MRTEELTIDTTGRELVDLTPDVRRFASVATATRGAPSERDQTGADGLLNVFVPHATAGLAVLELNDGSEPDLARLLESLLPKDIPYSHSHGSPGHGADHLLPALLSPSLVLPVTRGDVQLGTWQYVVLVDRNADNPKRRVRLSFIDG